MTKCISLANIDENLDCAEQDNMGGLTPKVIFGYWDDVAGWPSLPAGLSGAAVALDAAGALDGDVTMKSGVNAYTFEFGEDKGNFTIAPQGEMGSLSMLYTLTIVSARIRKTIFGFLNAVKNKKMFFIVQDANGDYYLMGDSRRAAHLNSGDGAASGTAATDANQTTLKFTFVSPRALQYAGDVVKLLTAVTVPAGS